LACLRVVSNEIDEFEQVIKPDTFWLPLFAGSFIIIMAVAVAVAGPTKAETQ